MILIVFGQNFEIPVIVVPQLSPANLYLVNWKLRSNDQNKNKKVQLRPKATASQLQSDVQKFQVGQAIFCYFFVKWLKGIR